jgi:hypothetical protein
MGRTNGSQDSVEFIFAPVSHLYQKAPCAAEQRVRDGIREEGTEEKDRCPGERC